MVYAPVPLQLVGGYQEVWTPTCSTHVRGAEGNPLADARHVPKGRRHKDLSNNCCGVERS
eukprot:1408943-Prorocentrum_lima.AAC.1